MDCVRSPSRQGGSPERSTRAALQAKALQSDTGFQPPAFSRVKNVGLQSHGGWGGSSALNGGRVSAKAAGQATCPEGPSTLAGEALACPGAVGFSVTLQASGQRCQEGFTLFPPATLRSCV